MKPSDINPLFSDEGLTPAEIQRARRVVAWEEMKLEVVEYRRWLRGIDYTTPSDAPIWEHLKKSEKRLIALSLELFPEEGKS